MYFFSPEAPNGYPVFKSWIFPLILWTWAHHEDVNIEYHKATQISNMTSHVEEGAKTNTISKSSIKITSNG